MQSDHHFDYLRTQLIKMGQTSSQIGETIAKVNYTKEQVSCHNTRKDCWVIIDRQIYDVSKFMSVHPGGLKSILMYGGRDCTSEFLRLHRKYQNALKLLRQYQVGVLVD